MKSLVIKVLLFLCIVYGIGAEPERNNNLFSSADHRSTHAAWSNLTEVRNSPSVKKTDTRSTDIDNLLQLENLGWTEYPNPFENFTFNDTSVCSNDISFVLQNLKDEEEWALKMIDSYGKPGSGILEGNLAWPGSYHECRGIHINSPNGTFEGRYCTIGWIVRLSSTSGPMTVSSGACFPSTCSESQLNQDYDKIHQFIGNIYSVKDIFSFVNITSISCKPLTKEFNTPAIFMLFLIAFFGMMAVLGSSVTVYEYFQDIIKMNNCRYSSGHELDEESIKVNESTMEEMQSPPGGLVILSESQDTNSVFKKLKPILKSFCVFTNGAKILNTDTGEGQLLCIHGIRFLSMTWVILGHIYLFIAQSVAVENPLEVLDEVDTFPFQIVLQGFFAVDSFFVLSGFLLTYLYFKEMTKSGGKMSWVYFYVHRYLRLTPVYMIVLGFCGVLTNYISMGPFSITNLIDDNCEKYWWRNILYINNLFDGNSMCMSWSWYLANDMQFYIISPLFLYSLWRRPRIGFSIIGIILIVSTITSFVITHKYNLVTGVSENSQGADFKKALSLFRNYFDKLYIKPYGRIGPYLIGVLLGYVLLKYKKSLSLLVLFFGWIIATLLTLLVLYGLYHTTLNVWTNSFYNAFGRIAFSLCLSWVIYVCLTSGGPVNQILSFKGFIPLSRLTYCAYLVHPMVILTYYENLRVPLYISQLTMVVLFIGLLSVIYAIAFLTTLLFESPIMGLEKEMRKLFTKPRTQQNGST